MDPGFLNQSSGARPNASRFSYPCKQELPFPGLEPALAAFTVQSNGSTSRRMARKLGKRVERIAPQTLERLNGYSWPRNIRDLQNTIERAAVMATSDTLVVDWDLGPTHPAPALRATNSHANGAAHEPPAAPGLLHRRITHRRVLALRSPLRRTAISCGARRGPPPSNPNAISHAGASSRHKYLAPQRLGARPGQRLPVGTGVAS